MPSPYCPPQIKRILGRGPAIRSRVLSFFALMGVLLLGEPSGGFPQGMGDGMATVIRQPTAMRQVDYEAYAAAPYDPGYDVGPELEPEAVLPQEVGPLCDAMPYEPDAIPQGPYRRPRYRNPFGRGMLLSGPGCGAWDGPGRPCYGGCPGSWDPCWRPLASRLWLREEYILWWTKGDYLPSLVTTGPLHAAGTTTLFGGTAVNNGPRSGIRDIVGYWLDDDHRCGLVGTYFVQGSISESFQGSSPSVLAFPYLDVETGAQSQFFLASPGVRTGSVSVLETSELEGAEFLLRRNLFQRCRGRVDLLLGYRYVRLGDYLRLSANTTATVADALDPAGTTRAISEQFDTLNEFHGAEFGVLGQWQRCRWSLELLAKVALGATNSHARVDGRTVRTVPGESPALSLGGLHSLPTNMGQYERSEFSAIPELGITVSRDLGCRLRATMGYTLIYWGKVMRPGEQVDLNINPTQIPPGTLAGSPEPRFSFASNDLWVHGLNAGLEYRF